MNASGNAYQNQWSLIKHFLVEKIELHEVQPTTHAKQRMVERGIEFGDIQDVSRFWSIDEMYEPGQYPYGDNKCKNPDPMFSITGQDSRGRKLTVAFAMKKYKTELGFVVMTVFIEDEHKNRHQTKLDKNSL